MKKKLLWALGILVIIAGIAIILIARYAGRVVDPYVRSLLEQNKPMHHQVEYGKIKLNLLNGSILVRDVRIYPEPGYALDEHIWLDVQVSMIKLTDFSLKEMLLHKNLVIGDFIILNPEVDLHLPLEVTSRTVEEIAADSVKREKSQLLKSITLETMMISGGTFRLIRNDVIMASSNEISFLARGISLIKDNKDDPVGYSYGDVQIGISNIALHSETGLYEMSLEKFSIGKLDSSIVIEGFRMKPKFDKKEFSAHLKTQNDRFDIDIKKISVNRIGFRRFFAGDPLLIASLVLDSVNADIYRDKNVAFDFNKFPPYHNELFLKLKFPVILDTLSVINSMIQYGELIAEQPQAGIIRLEEFSMTSYNLKSMPADDTIDDVMRLIINAKVMGEGPMNVELVLPLEGDTRKIECSGSVGAMQLSPLNDMLEPSISMKINGGMVTRMTFAFSGNDNFSNGWMEFLYKDLDVQLQKKDPDKQFGFLSLLANTMANSNNPQSEGKPPKVVEIGYERDKNKGLINFIWKTLQSGMVRTILPMSKYQVDTKQKEKKDGVQTKENSSKDKRKKQKK